MLCARFIASLRKVMDNACRSSLVESPMGPRSPPAAALDLYGKRRQMVKVQVLEREIGLLQVCCFSILSLLSCLTLFTTVRIVELEATLIYVQKQSLFPFPYLFLHFFCINNDLMNFHRPSGKESNTGF